MVKLLAREKKRIQLLERRMEHLHHRIENLTGRDVTWDKEERDALLWVLEVVEHAAATNCEEAFLYSTTRAPKSEEARRLAEYMIRKKLRDEAAKVKGPANQDDDSTPSP